MPTMGAPEQTVCSSWAGIADVCGPCAAYGFPVDLLEAKLLYASEVLFYATGMRWPGLCTDTIRPCAAYGPRLPIGAYQSWSGQSITATGAAAHGICGCQRDTRCGCSSLSVIDLPRTPVTSIEAVMIDGQVLDPAFYRIDDYRSLVYLPGEGDTRQGWPCCQRLELPTTEPETFQVTYNQGTPPPFGGVEAAAALGCEFALAVADPGSCQLAGPIQSIARQGISIQFMDAAAMVSGGVLTTGLREVDMWLASLELAKAHRPSAVYNPDDWARRRHRRVTG